MLLLNADEIKRMHVPVSSQLLNKWAVIERAQQEGRARGVGHPRYSLLRRYECEEWRGTLPPARLPEASRSLNSSSFEHRCPVSGGSGVIPILGQGEGCPGDVGSGQQLSTGPSATCPGGLRALTSREVARRPAPVAEGPGRQCQPSSTAAKLKKCKNAL